MRYTILTTDGICSSSYLYNHKRLSTYHIQRTYRKNRINIEQDANEREENAHGDFKERNTYILDEYNRTQEQQVIAYGYSVGGAATVASTQSKNYDNNCFAVGCKKKGISLSTKMTFTLAQYLRIFYVKDRRPCWMAFSHRSLKNDPRMKMNWSLSCVRTFERSYVRMLNNRSAYKRNTILNGNSFVSLSRILTMMASSEGKVSDVHADRGPIDY
jgi:hypothetical protein